ncbi:hypothetical protein QFC22_001144 [Naganishia vaughanmartiniae]|uniref:Uncharacterized protein n=1 Tax=Naganishia vaughanmartiniae TaxID=1424756 RepID=A0ACC2XK22_9TREE|nr:hypothetical protein QFC22_001144 [Naganishia vaughanmartiniae]
MRQHEHVILLRNASSIDPQQDAAAGQTTADPYEFAITARGLLPHTLPVLGQEFVNVSRLQEVFQHPEDWAAVVATSKRAGEAWVDAIRSRPADNKEISESFPRP